MTVFAIAGTLFLCVGTFYFWRTRSGSREILERFPPIGEFVEVNGMKVHHVDLPRQADHEAAIDDNESPSIVFLHGASGNLRDAHFTFSERLQGKARLLFFDRPGHGFSERNDVALGTVNGQADHLIAVLDRLSIKNAILVGHSWGAALALTTALRHKERISGLVLAAPVSHPWPGGINWYYHVAPLPLIGPLLAYLFALPLGLRQIDCATAKVFWPDRVTPGYRETIGAEMVLVPERFMANAADIDGLREHLVNISPRYGEINKPVFILSGEKDQVVLPWVHAEALARTLPNCRIARKKASGHMPHHAHADDIAVALEEMIASYGKPTDQSQAVFFNAAE
ncbi:MAG: alpha/beta hydrolase [Pseudomonadota bacterium]